MESNNKGGVFINPGLPIKNVLILMCEKLLYSFHGKY